MCARHVDSTNPGRSNLVFRSKPIAEAEMSNRLIRQHRMLYRGLLDSRLWLRLETWSYTCSKLLGQYITHHPRLCHSHYARVYCRLYHMPPPSSSPHCCCLIYLTEIKVESRYCHHASAIITDCNCIQPHPVSSAWPSRILTWLKL